MTTLGAVHFVFALVALASGGAVTLVRKGTRWHRTLGHVYVTNMLGMLVTALLIFDLFGGWGPFHTMAVFAFAVLAVGMAAVLARRPRRRWVEAHAHWMTGSYVGLWAAAMAETATRLTDLPFWVGVVAGSLVPGLVALVLWPRLVPRAIARAKRPRDGRDTMQEASPPPISSGSER